MATSHELTSSADDATRSDEPERAGRNIDAWGDTNTRRFLIAQFLYLTSDSMTALTLAGVVLIGSENTIEPRAVVTALAFAMIPYAIVGPLSGQLADRWLRRRALGGLSAMRALLIAGAAMAVAVDSVPLAIVFAAPLMCVGRLFYMLRAASLPRVAPPGLLVRVDSCSLYTSITASALGATIAAVSVFGGPVVVLAAAAAMQLIAGLMFVTLPLSLGGGERTRRHGGWSAAGRAMRSRTTRRAVSVTIGHRFFVGGLFGTLLIVASHDFGLADRAHLVGLVVTGLGSFIGTLTAPALRFWLGIDRLAVAGYVAPCALLLIAVVVGFEDPGGRVIVGAVAIATYFAFQNVRVATDAVVQTSTADVNRAKLFSLYDAAYNVAYYGGGALAILAGFHLRPTLGIATIAGLYGLGALWLATSHNRLQLAAGVTTPHGEYLVDSKET
jgi:MFS family permease